MPNFQASYGITTFQRSVALSAITGFTMAPNVVSSHIRHVSGGTLYLTSTGVNHATMFAVGAILSSGANIHEEIWGPAGFQLAAGGATVVVSIVQGLSQGYVGAY